MSNFHNDSQSTDDTQNGIDVADENTESRADVDPNNDTGQDTTNATSSTHTRSIGTVVNPLDGRTGSNGVAVSGVYLGQEKAWNVDTNQLEETGKALIGFFPIVSAVDESQIEDAV